MNTIYQQLLRLINRRVFVLLFIPVFLLGFGTAGYIFLEGWSLSDAFYMTAITLTTVGYGEVQPLDGNGRFFTILLILLGAAYLAYGLEYLLSASIGGQFRRRRLMRELNSMQDHIIICGYGRVGANAIVSLNESSSRGVVVIERDEHYVEAAAEAGYLVLEGDATDDEVLLAAGIERAWGVLVCTGDDSQNLFIVLSTRALKSDLFIVTRSTQANEAKMRRAGANRVVSPHRIGGRHMANIMVRPHVTDFLDVVTVDGGLELWMEELVIESGAVLVGQTVGESEIRQKTGVLLIAIVRHATGKTMTPMADTRLEAGDELILLGTREQLATLEQLTTGRSIR